MNYDDPYTILGVDVNADTATITSAYRNLAKTYHPDKPGGDPDKFKKIAQAYGTLTNKRRAPKMESDEPMIFSKNFNLDKNNEVFNDLFNNVFNKNVSPITCILHLSLKEIYIGCTKELKYFRNLMCNHCYGTGHIHKTICSFCHGHKTVSTETMIDVNILPGMDSRVKIKFENMGNEEPHKSTGDLIIQLEIEPHKLFKTHDSDLEITIEITLLESLCGVTRDIVFVDDNTIRLTTPPNQIVSTQEPFIYKGSGLPIYSESSLTKYGDLYVNYKTVIPTNISSTLKQKLIELLLT